MRETARIENAGNETVEELSLTLMRMPSHSPTLDGVPERRPVDVLNVAHEGLFAIV